MSTSLLPAGGMMGAAGGRQASRAADLPQPGVLPRSGSPELEQVHQAHPVPTLSGRSLLPAGDAPSTSKNAGEPNESKLSRRRGEVKAGV